MTKLNHDQSKKVLLKRTGIVLGILLLQFLIVISGTATITPSFYAMNQANMSQSDSYGNFALGDYLFITDTTTVSTGEVILERNWTVSGPGYFQIQKNIMNPVFGSFDLKGQVFVNLTVTNATGYQYPTVYNVYHVMNGTDWISAGYRYDVKYDNTSIDHPLGTINFHDNSVEKFYPEAKITDWWWRYTNSSGEITGNYSGSNSFYLPMNSWPDSYSINLTVKNSQGDLVSVSNETAVPPDDVHTTAGFAVTPVSGSYPLNISVVDQSKSMANYTMTDIPVTYKYVVGNSTNPNVFGKFFTSQNFNLTLQYPGTYNITQTVTNAFGQSDNKTIEGIEVFNSPPPDVDFSASPRSGKAPLDVSFTSIVDGTGPFSYEWDFGDGTPVIYDVSQPNHTYQDSGVYNVTLEVTGAGGPTLVNKIGFIAASTTPPPIADFAVANSVGEVPLTVSFIGLANGTGTLVYTWDFGDGVGNAIGRNPTYTYDTAGLYNVTCTVSDGTKTGQVTRDNCIRVLNQTNEQPMAMFAAAPRNGTAPLEVAFIDQSVGEEPISWEWYFGDNTPKSHLKNPVHTYETPGIYDVTLMIHAANGTSIVNNTGFITVHDPVLPYAEFAATPLSGSAPLNVSFIDQSTGEKPLSYVWSFGDGSNESSVKNPVHIYEIPGIYSVNLTVTNNAGTSVNKKADLIQVVHADDPIAMFTASIRTGPAPLNVSFVDQSKGDVAIEL